MLHQTNEAHLLTLGSAGEHPISYNLFIGTLGYLGGRDILTSAYVSLRALDHDRGLA